MRTDAILYAGLGLATILALPACSFQSPVLIHTFQPGPTPQSHVVFCDIEVIGTGFDNTSRVCADVIPLLEVQQAVPLTSAALALNTGKTSVNGLDKSPDAVNRCGSNGEIVPFQGQFPKGNESCLNCGAQIPSVYPDANAVCQAICQDMSVAAPSNLSIADIATFCANHAHVSTNVPASGCPIGFDNACTDAGTLLIPFTDPRIFQEPVVWTELTGVAAGGPAGNDLTMTAPTVPNQFTAQAVSAQTVTGGDAYVEFSAGETTLDHLIGFQMLPQNCPPACTDPDPTPGDIEWTLRLGVGGLVFVQDLGTRVNGPGLNGSFQTYEAGDRFRITLTDLNNGSFTVQYAKVVGVCNPGVPCNLLPFYTDTVTGTYPVRLDTSFRDHGAQLLNVTLVRIQPPQ